MDNDEIRERLAIQDQERAGNNAASTASALSQQSVKKRIQNPEFADKIRDIDLPEDGDYEWLESVLGPTTSGAYATANLPTDQYDQLYFLNRNLRERHVAETNMGVLLKEHPRLAMIAMGEIEPPGMADMPPRYKPLKSDEKRVLRESYEAATALQSLGIEKAGLEGLTTATAEHRTVTDERKNKSQAREKVEAFFG